MKKILLFSVLCLMGLMTYAQQALWGGAPVVSPEIHDDNTVTFRLKAPKAVRVQVTGDFLPPIPVQAPRGGGEAALRRAAWRRQRRSRVPAAGRGRDGAKCKPCEAVACQSVNPGKSARRRKVDFVNTPIVIPTLQNTAR